VRIPGATPSPTALAGGNLLEYGAVKVRQDGLVSAGSSATIVIPSFIPFTIQFGSEWPDEAGFASVTGMENDRGVGITYTQWNGYSPGTSAYGGASCTESSSATLLTVGSSNKTCTLKCPGEAAGDHNLAIQAGIGLGCRYRVIY
jgi:hypothetical protein